MDRSAVAPVHCLRTPRAPGWSLWAPGPGQHSLMREDFLIKLQDVDRVGGRWHLLPDGGACSSREVTAWGALAYSQRGTWCLWPGGLSDRRELRRRPGTQGPGQEPGRLPQTPCLTGSGRASRSRRSGSQAPDPNGRTCPEPGVDHGDGRPASGLHPGPAGPSRRSRPKCLLPASD